MTRLIPMGQISSRHDFVGGVHAVPPVEIQERKRCENRFRVVGVEMLSKQERGDSGEG